MTRTRQAIEQFSENIKSAKDLCAVYNLINDGDVSMDVTEVLRAAIVMGVSALDCFIHNLIVGEIVDVYAGESSNEFNQNLLKPSENIFELLSILSKDKTVQLQRVEKKLHRVLEKKTFQDPAVIADNMKKIGINDLWSRVVGKENINYSVQDIKDKLELIVNRRNVIAHEADIDRTTRDKNEISDIETLDYINFIELLCNTMYEVVTNIIR